MIKEEDKYEIYLIFLVLLGLYLSLMENLIPKPFPWMKIGLSNIAVLIALEKFGKKMAIETVLIRIFTQALMLGSLFTPGFIISLSAGAISTCVTIFMYRYRKYLSMLSISCLSAFIHNCIQLVVVYFLMFRNIPIKSKSIMIFVFLFLLLGVVTGLITGFIVEKLNLTKRNLITKK